MSMLSKFDVIMYEAQRQGRVSFYMQNQGETAAQLGSASALDPDDLVFGKLIEGKDWRNFDLYVKNLICVLF